MGGLLGRCLTLDNWRCFSPLIPRYRGFYVVWRPYSGRMRNPDSWFRSQYVSELHSWFDGLSRDGLLRRQRRFRRLAQVIKQRRGCASCGYNKMASGLDFDHMPGHWTIFNLSSPPDILRLVEFKQEIAKCQVLCATCHREVTVQRKRGGKRRWNQWAWFHRATPENRRVIVVERLMRAMVISKREAETQADVFFALRSLSEMQATTNENDLEYSSLCSAILAGALPKPEKKSCAW